MGRTIHKRTSQALYKWNCVSCHNDIFTTTPVEPGCTRCLFPKVKWREVRYFTEQQVWNKPEEKEVRDAIEFSKALIQPLEQFSQELPF